MFKYKKIVLSVLFFLLLVFLGVLTFFLERKSSIIIKNQFCNSLSFALADDTINAIVHPFETGNGYTVILPAYWDIKKILIKYNGSIAKTLEISEEKYDSRWNPIKIKLGEPYSFKIAEFLKSKKMNQKLIFYQSKLNAVFIDTDSGSLCNIEKSEDKSYSEAGQMLAISNSGHVEYHGRLESIHGRGNMTWSLHKKPYSIKIADRAVIGGLKEAKKFNLLANACDESSLRNWIMFNTAQALNMPFSISAEFVSLFINGHYRGLYQITNKVDIDESGINIYDLGKETKLINKKTGKKLKNYPKFSIDKNDTIGFKKGIDGAKNPKDITGGYLLDTSDKLHRYAENPSGFIPQFGYPIEIKEPELATREQVDYISNYFNEMMDAIRAEDGINHKTEKHFSDYIDIDSYIKYYLCSEFFYNLDAVFASFIMHKDKGGKMFCGPMWDNDISLNTKIFFDDANGYNSLFVREAREKDGSLMIFGQLYKHPEYRNKLIQIFNKEFKPIIKSYTDGIVLDSINAKISNDLYLNNIRWSNEYKWMYDLLYNERGWNERGRKEFAEIEKNGDYWNIKNFMQKRIDFLSNIWATPESEKRYLTILWDFNTNNAFQFHTTIIAFLIKNEPFIWPRFMVKNEEVELDCILDHENNPVKEGEIRDYMKIVYKPLGHKSK